MPGFLPNSRGSLTLDLLVVAMGLIIPVLGLSIYRVKFKKSVQSHRVIQSILAVVLAIAVIAFELDMRLNGWRHLAEPSPYYQSLVFPALTVHLCFSIPTLLLWSCTIGLALRFAIDSNQNKARFQHRKLGWLSSLAMLGTTVTGWTFYYLAFVAA